MSSIPKDNFDIPPAPAPPPPPAPAPAPPASPLDLSGLAGATYGRKMPILAGGKARIGGAIMWGPFAPDGSTTITTHASFGLSFGVAVPVTGTRTLYEIALDSKVAWTSTGGTTNIAAGTFSAETFTARFYQGTLTQAADPLEIAQFGSSEAVAYRPQMLIFFQNLALAAFGGKIPYGASLIGDTTDGADPDDGINLGEALERLAYSPWAGYTSAEFETDGIVDVVPFALIDREYTIVSLAQELTKIYRNLDVLQTDKLRVRDYGALSAPDITLTANEVLARSDRIIDFRRDDVSKQPRILELTTIDPDADYTWVPTQAQRPRDPVVVSGSVGKQSILLPVGMDAATRRSMAHYALFAMEGARKNAMLSATAVGYAIESGDRVGLVGVGDGFEDEIFKVVETLHGANYVVDFRAESIMLCQFAFEEDDAHVTCFNDLVGAASYTAEDIDLGGADANRHIVLTLSCRANTLGLTFSSVTIGGVTATQRAFASNTTTAIISAVYSANVPTGTTGDIVVTMSGTFGQITGSVYRKVSASFAFHDDDDAQAVTDGAITCSVDIPASGFMVAAGATRNGAQFTWEGATARCSYWADSSTTGMRSSASYSGGVESNHAVSIDPPTLDAMALAVASFTVP